MVLVSNSKNRIQEQVVEQILATLRNPPSRIESHYTNVNQLSSSIEIIRDEQSKLTQRLGLRDTIAQVQGANGTGFVLAINSSRVDNYLDDLPILIANLPNVLVMGVQQVTDGNMLSAGIVEVEEEAEDEGDDNSLAWDERWTPVRDTLVKDHCRRHIARQAQSKQHQHRLPCLMGTVSLQISRLLSVYYMCALSVRALMPLEASPEIGFGSRSKKETPTRGRIHPLPTVSPIVVKETISPTPSFSFYTNLHPLHLISVNRRRHSVYQQACSSQLQSS